MPLYFHARQFPHLAGKTDAEIKQLVTESLAKRPSVLSVARGKYPVFLAALVIVAAFMVLVRGWQVGPALMGAATSVFLLLLVWGYCWVNIVLFRITQEDLRT
jgi:hypothetical protein